MTFMKSISIPSKLGGWCSQSSQRDRPNGAATDHPAEAAPMKAAIQAPSYSRDIQVENEISNSDVAQRGLPPGSS